MSENKEFPIPFDESRRGKRANQEEKSIGRRLLGRAVDRPSIGRSRGRGRDRDIDLPTGGKPGTRRPTGTIRDIDGDGWVDEGTTNPRWIGLPGSDDRNMGTPDAIARIPGGESKKPKSSRDIDSMLLSSGRLRDRPVVEPVDKTLQDGSLDITPSKGVIGMRDGGFSRAKKPNKFDSFLRHEYREWSIGDEKVVFGIPERPESMSDDPGYYEGDAKTVEINPYVISGLSAESEEGREVAKKWAYAKSQAEVIGNEEPTYVEALLYAGSRGDTEAMRMFDELAKEGKEAADTAKQQRAELYIKSYNDEDTQQELKRAGLDKLSIDDLYLVHETRYEPEFDEDGNLVLRPLGDWVLKNRDGEDATYDRETIHFAMNHLAGGHLMRQRPADDEKRYIVVSKLSDILEMNPDSVDAMNPVDVGLVPPPNQPLRLPKKSTRVLENPDPEQADSLVSQTLKEMGAKHIFTAGEYGNPTESKAILKIAAEIGASTDLHANTPSGAIEQIDRGSDLASSFIGTKWLGEMSGNAIARLGNSSKWHGLKQTGYSMSREEYEDLLNSNSGKLPSDSGRSEILFSGKPPRYPRPPAYGPLIGGAEDYFDGVDNWQEFAEKYRGRDIVWIDYETTGLVFDEFGQSSSNGKPVQLGAVKVRDGQIVDRFNVFINPGEPLGEWSRENLRGPNGEKLTDEWLSGQMSIADAHRQFSEFAGVDAILGLQNAAFDKNVLEDELKEYGIDWRPTGYIDTMDMSGMTLPKWTPENQDGPSMVGSDGERRASSSLKAITEYLDVELGDKHHTADADAEAAAMVMENLIAKAIENDWPTDAIKPDTRRDFVEKRKADFDEKVSKFEADKKQYIASLKESESTDKLSSGAQPSRVIAYGDARPGTDERITRNKSNWLKGLSSKQIAKLVVPESEEQYIDMVIDDYVPGRDKENPQYIAAIRASLIERLNKTPWARADYSPESQEKIREFIESSLDSSPVLKWSFQTFGAPVFAMMTAEGADLYENQPALKAQIEQISAARGIKPFVGGIQHHELDMVTFNKKLLVDGLSSTSASGTTPLISMSNHVVRLGDANIDASAQSTLNHEYGHWLQKRALRESERTKGTSTGSRFGSDHIPDSVMSSVISTAQSYEDKNLDELIGQAYRSNMPMESTPEIPRALTTYAHTNAREMIAEGFNAFFHPNADIKQNAINAKLRNDVYKLLGLKPGDEPWSTGVIGTASRTSEQRAVRGERKLIAMQSLNNSKNTSMSPGIVKLSSGKTIKYELAEISKRANVYPVDYLADDLRRESARKTLKKGFAGGFTVEPDAVMKDVKSGIAVARNKHGMTFSVKKDFVDGEPTESLVDTFLSWVDFHGPFVFGNPKDGAERVTLGGWVSDGQLYLDVVDVFPNNEGNLGMAKELGKAEQQIAVTNLDRLWELINSNSDDMSDAFIDSGGNGGLTIGKRTIDKYSQMLRNMNSNLSTTGSRKMRRIGNTVKPANNSAGIDAAKRIRYTDPESGDSRDFWVIAKNGSVTSYSHEEFSNAEAQIRRKIRDGSYLNAQGIPEVDSNKKLTPEEILTELVSNSNAPTVGQLNVAKNKETGANEVSSVFTAKENRRMGLGASMLKMHREAYPDMDARYSGGNNLSRGDMEKFAKGTPILVGEGKRIQVGDENVVMLSSTPIEKLARRHQESRDWREVRAVDAEKRKMIAEAYRLMAEMDASEEVRRAWDITAREIEKQFKMLTEDDGIKVEFVDEDPYKDFHEMYDDVMKNGRLKVLKTEATGGHPYWTNEVNDMFRAVHDAYGHLGTGRGFDRHGEEAAFQAHKSMFPKEAHKALYTELRGQNQFLIFTGEFGEQKIAFLPDELMEKILRRLAGTSSKKKISADDDNAFEKGGSHHVSGGRHFAKLNNNINNGVS